MSYRDLKDLEENNKATIQSMFNGILSNVKNTSLRKLTDIIKDIPSICRMHYVSYEYAVLKRSSFNKVHPVVPVKGEIYNAFITVGVGRELCGMHPVVIMQNQSQNIHADKVNVLPIEGDGNKINPRYQIAITSDDLEGDAHLNKNPSRVIISDILTIDKARLDIKIGKLKEDKLIAINQLLKKQLDL